MALPSPVRAANATTLRFIPQIDLAFLDPHWTTANVTRGHGHMVFDTLYGQDGTFTSSLRVTGMLNGFATFWNVRPA
jgi:peptide/nickel transport system substrate-binding protein